MRISELSILFTGIVNSLSVALSSPTAGTLLTTVAGLSPQRCSTVTSSPVSVDACESCSMLSSAKPRSYGKLLARSIS
ncbi:hypothetical protein PIB30_091689, partial [Stylosanthes scabra]|nr:hypothetical protein [Stylosanthes scabra]